MEIEQGIALMRAGFEKVVKVVEEKQEDLSSFTREEYMALHSAVYKLCSTGDNRHVNAQRIYDSYANAFDHYLSSHVLPSLHRHHCGHYHFLRTIHQSWLSHTLAATWLSRLLHYLDRSYLRRRGLRLLGEAAVERFRDRVFDEVEPVAAGAVLSLIEAERDGRGAVEASLVRAVAVDLFVAMGMGDLSRYEADLEAALLQETAAYYSREAAKWTGTSVPGYMARAEAALKNEKERVSRYLHPSTEPRMVEVVRRELLVSPAERLFEDLDSGFLALVRADDTESVKMIFQLYLDIPEQLKQLAELFRRQVEEEGTEAVRGEAEVIENLMKIHSKYMSVYVRDCFHSHEFFEKALTDAFVKFSNEKVSAKPVAELMAVFCEEMLRNGGSGEKMSEEAVEETLENVARLLVYINDKDLFAELHRKNLSDRLLFGKSKTEDYKYDKYLLAKMKQEMGDWCTTKLEGMLNDMRISKENEGDYSKFLSKRCNKDLRPGVRLNTTVLTTHRWPITFRHESLAVPAEMATCIKSFSKFYATKFQTRKLSFLYSLGTCIVQGNFEEKSFDLVLLPHQAIVLMLFNDNDKLSYSEIMTQTKIEDQPSLRAALQSLSCAKHNILNKDSNNNNISSNDVFVFNSKFKSKMRRIKIPLPKIVEEENETKNEANSNVSNNRRYTIDAALVRIAKSRKVISYQQLVNECVTLVTSMFVPDLKLIKLRVESLLEREYLERDAEDPNLLRYVA